MSGASLQKEQLLNTIAVVASTPAERLQQGWVPETWSAEAETRWQRLSQLLGIENEEQEQRLLKQWQLSHDQLLRALSLPPSIETASRPGWVSTLEHILLDDDTTAPSLQANEHGASAAKAALVHAYRHEVLSRSTLASPGDSDLLSEHPFPFEELLFPFVHYARKQLLARVPTWSLLVSQEAHSELERWFLDFLTGLAGRVLQSEFIQFRLRHHSPEDAVQVEASQSSRQSYQAFLKHYQGKNLFMLLIEYCTLARLLVQRVEQWIETCQEFLQRLEEDRLAIEHHFQFGDQPSGSVVRMEVGCSDPHHHGRSVFILEFANGRKLIYKPRCLDTDLAFFRFFDWLHARKLSTLSPSLKGVRTLSRATHGWVEYVEHLPCQRWDEVQRYYQRAGQLMCLLYVLQATDMHYENIIANGEYPVPIDLETIMTPAPPCLSPNDPFGRSSQLRDASEYSVHQSTLLPMKLPFQGKTLDLSFLGCVSDFDVPAKIPRWKDLNTDAMRLVYETIHLDASKNGVILNGAVIKASDYLEEIVVGFRTMYNILMHHRNDLLAPDGPLSWFVGCPIRYVFRPTFIYEKLLHRLINPFLLRDGADPWVEMQIFKKPLLRSDADPSLWAMIEAELEALARFDLPHFSARAEGRDLFTEGESTIPNAFGTSALDQIRACLAHLSVEDLEHQLSLIRDALVEGSASASAAPMETAAL